MGSLHTSPEKGALALVVDDDLHNREALTEELENLGWRVVSAENGRRALEVSARAPLPNVILLDLMMPVMTGWQFLEARQRDLALAKVPVVVISAALGAAAKLPNVAGYLRKPVATDKLIEVLEAIRSGAGASEHDAVEHPAVPIPDVVAKGALRVLLIQERDDDAQVTLAQLQAKHDFKFEVRRVATLAEGLDAAVLTGTDVILADLQLSKDGGLIALKKLVRRASSIPLVAISSAAGAVKRDEALRVGAQEAIEREAQTPDLLARALHHAFERLRLKHELERASELAAYERERRGLEQLAQSRSTVASEMLGQTPLKRSAPATFQRLAAQFVTICEAAIAAREHELEPKGLRDDLQRLADGLAALRAGPGDIVDVYQDALTTAWSRESTELGAAKREEARLMLIGLLGYVLAAYRLYAGQERTKDS